MKNLKISKERLKRYAEEARESETIIMQARFCQQNLRRRSTISKTLVNIASMGDHIAAAKDSIIQVVEIF